MKHCFPFRVLCQIYLPVLNAGGKPEVLGGNLRKQVWTCKPIAHTAPGPGIEPMNSLVQGEGSSAAPPASPIYDVKKNVLLEDLYLFLSSGI